MISEDMVDHSRSEYINNLFHVQRPAHIDKWIQLISLSYTMNSFFKAYCLCHIEVKHGHVFQVKGTTPHCESADIVHFRHEPD